MVFLTTLRIFMSTSSIVDTLAASNEAALRQYTWVLFDAAGKPLRQGKDALAALPLASQTEVILPANSVSFVRATLPAGNRKRMLDALPFLIEDHLITAPEQVHVVIAESLSENDAVLASIDQALLADLLKTCKVQGLLVNRILPETLVPKITVNSWVLVCNGDDSFARTGSASGFAFELNALQTEPPLALQLALQQDKAEQNLPNEIAVYGNQHIDLAAWSQLLAVRFVAKEADWKVTPPVAGMNFLQGKFQPASQGWAWLSQAKPALVLLAAMLLVALIGSSVDWARKANEKNRLDKEMKALFMNAFPDATNVVDAPLQMQRKLAEMQHASGGTESGDFLPLLAAVTASTGGLANISAMDYQNGQLSLSLQAPSEEAARALAEKLSVSGRIVAVQNLKTTNNGVDFQLVFKADALKVDSQ
jgi:general secretion pathway protein L